MKTTITLKTSTEDNMSIRDWLLEYTGAEGGSLSDNLAEYAICYLLSNSEWDGNDVTVELL